MRLPGWTWMSVQFGQLSAAAVELLGLFSVSGVWKVAAMRL